MSAAADAPSQRLRLEPKQGIAFQTQANEFLYGGAKGGGKSYYLRVSAIRWAQEVPGVQIYLFRRKLPDLRRNHLQGPTSFFRLLNSFLKAGLVKYKSVENEFEWVETGSVIHLCYCDSEADVENYQGAEIHVLMMDELTHYTDYQYRYLRAQVRVAGLQIPEKYKGMIPRIETGSNPGSVGHAWVRRSFISPKQPLEIWRTPKEEGGMLRQFIPAKLSDNPHLTKDDPEYQDRLHGMGSENLVRAMLEGDWDIVAGQAFEKLRRDVQCIEPIDPPEDWACFGSLDWGSTRPFSYGMWTVSNGNELPDGRTYRRGAIIRYNEWYGWNGKPNEGLRMEVEDVAAGIKSRERGRTMVYRIADPSMWKVDGGPSHAERMIRHGVVLRRGDNSRIAGYLQLRGRIAGDEEGPMLYVTKNCHDGFWRTMPDIVMDENHPEDVDTDQEDHCFAAGTLVLTDCGPMPIEVLTMANVLTTKGWRVAYRTEPRIAPCVKLTYDDGSTVVCTQEHKFLTAGGWKCAIDLLDDISYNVLSNRRAQWSISRFASLAKRVRNSWACAIGSAVDTFSAKVSGFMWPLRRSCSAVGSLTVTGAPITFITRTGTQLTTSQETSSWWTQRRISACTQSKAIIQRGSSQCAKAQENGTVARLEENGTPSTLEATSTRSLPTRLRKIASSAASLLWQYGFTRTALSIATLTARQRRCVSVERVSSSKVFCLHVPSVHNFALCDGSIVHNCYDDSRYAAMSRPWMQIVKPKEKPRDDWLRFEEKTEDSWRTA